jgi:hypothetical protein
MSKIRTTNDQSFVRGLLKIGDYWETKRGRKIPYSHMTDSTLSALGGIQLRQFLESVRQEVLIPRMIKLMYLQHPVFDEIKKRKLHPRLIFKPKYYLDYEGYISKILSELD